MGDEDRVLGVPNGTRYDFARERAQERERGGARKVVPGTITLGIAALTCLTVQLGLYLAPPASAGLHAIEWTLSAISLRLANLRSPLASILVAVGLVLSLIRTSPAAVHVPQPLGTLFDVLSTLVVLALALRLLADLARAHERLLERLPRPEHLLIGGFLSLTLLGAAFLSLPTMAARGPLTPIDALFTATSAVCVTGLGVWDTGEDLSFRGQAVLLTLFQLGGLGVVTVIGFGMFLAGKRQSVRQLAKMQSLVQVDSVPDVRRQVLFLVLSALALEAVGAVLLYVALPSDAAVTGPRPWWAVFHAVSAFCNAGFSLEGDSLVGLRGAAALNLTVVALFVLGGLGAPALRELVRVARARFARRFDPAARARYIPPLSIQARLALVPTAALLILGALGFYALEARGALRGLPTGEAALAAFFQSATARTAGFATLDFAALSDATLLFITGLMAVGASPMSTGGGIKTATLMVLLVTLRAAARGREEVEYSGRVIARTAVRTALAVAFFYVAVAALGVLCLSLTDPGIPLRDRIFEAVSALSTTGLSTGVTAQWGTPGKLVLCLLMFAGRVGPATLMLSALHPREDRARYRYPKAPVLLG